MNSIFESEIAIRLDNIDLNNHVHRTNIEYKQALTLYGKILVYTQMDSVNDAQSKINFWIVKKVNEKIAAQGYLTYTMISLKNGRPVRIPEEIINKYSI